MHRRDAEFTEKQKHPTITGGASWHFSNSLQQVVVGIIGGQPFGLGGGKQVKIGGEHKKDLTGFKNL